MRSAVDIRVARTLLFVPGDRPDRFAKAAASGADGIVLDLEDAVAPAAKDTAREHVRRWLADGKDAVVRVNAPATAWHEADVAMLTGRQSIVMLPKTEDPGQVAALMDRLEPGSAVVPVLETAGGVLDARAICATPGVARAAFGNGDLAAQLGVDLGDHVALAQARGTVVLGAAAAGVAPPLDGVTTAVDDETVLVADTEHARRLGFTGRLCIHPRQIPVVHRTFAPSPAELRSAQRVLAASPDGAATVLDGRMIDQAVVERARRVVDSVTRPRVAPDGHGLSPTRGPRCRR